MSKALDRERPTDVFFLACSCYKYFGSPTGTPSVAKNEVIRIMAEHFVGLSLDQKGKC